MQKNWWEVLVISFTGYHTNLYRRSLYWQSCSSFWHDCFWSSIFHSISSIFSGFYLPSGIQGCAGRCAECGSEGDDILRGFGGSALLAWNQIVEVTVLWSQCCPVLWLCATWAIPNTGKFFFVHSSRLPAGSTTLTVALRRSSIERSNSWLDFQGLDFPPFFQYC